MKLLRTVILLQTAPMSDRYNLWLSSYNAKCEATPIFKVTKRKKCAYFAKKCIKPISFFECKKVDKIKSGIFMILPMFILSKWRLYFYAWLAIFIQTHINNRKLLMSPYSPLYIA